ncbi:hypothetical protein LCGC14_2658250 [marine sediment metagenome]|uniref:Uncharacterized protein n=1 Tax=marine sediment metagenome TaxID=412755 RepID=A0A0F8ZSU6_9ZZZZ
MSHELKEGVKLKSVYWSEGDFVIWKQGVKEIVICEQMAQMSMVPWARIVFESGPDHLVNCASLDGLQLFE